MRRSKGVLIAFIAAVLELVLVAGVSNQWVTKRVLENTTNSDIGDAIVRGATAFGWRFNPQGGRDAIWAGQLIGIGVLVGLVFLFVWALTGRSSRSFLGTFVGIWGVTLLAAVIAAVVATVIAYPDLFRGRDQAGRGRWAHALVEGPNSTVVMFGVLSGFVVALIAAIVAVSTAREVEPVVVVAEPESEEPVWSPDTAPPWGNEYPPGYTAPLPEQGYAPGANPELATYASERPPTATQPQPQPQPQQQPQPQPQSEPQPPPSEPARPEPSRETAERPTRDTVEPRAAEQTRRLPATEPAEVAEGDRPAENAPPERSAPLRETTEPAPESGDRPEQR